LIPTSLESVSKRHFPASEILSPLLKEENRIKQIKAIYTGQRFENI
jgi:hypothetical protein